eukprot:TRINITY_DN3283_c0_g1_i9.p1 TRINITY_DN3283_c0_g1~~TRINITY_DN3283_c0_g1_i9.p1  ORF type:complete len:116 (+),score=12.57 TRINITY_DN3283_c0_g1_i9:384-731(+)
MALYGSTICKVCQIRGVLSIFFLSPLIKTWLLFFKTIRKNASITYRPGRSNAGSIKSGRFVAPITNTELDDCNPSSSARSCDTMRSITPPESAPFPRFGAKESSSSKKITQGRAS